MMLLNGRICFYRFIYLFFVKQQEIYIDQSSTDDFINKNEYDVIFAEEDLI